MMMSTAQQIRNCLEEVLHYMQPYMSFVNCHMVNYFTDHLWDLHIPKSIKDSIKHEEDLNKALDQFWSNGNDEIHQQLFAFVKESKKYHMENLSVQLTLEELKLFLNHTENKNLLSIKEFMSDKKRHEVETTANLIQNLVKYKRNNKEILVVDAGDGKGYLSSRLALQNQIKVLGIDANEVNTESARKRNQKLERAWDGITQRAILIDQGIKPPRRGRKPIKRVENNSESNLKTETENYKLLNEFITPEVNLVNLLENNFSIDEKNIEICLCGLHTCGNLASTCLKLFIAQETVTMLCNIGCCYHLLNEEYSKEEFFANKTITEKNPHYGFPMSEYLREKKIKLGRNARMLASQSIHRTIQNKDLPSESLLYRALLEVLIKERKPEMDRSEIQVGKIRNYSTFRDYVEKCDKKLNFDINDLDDSIYEDLMEKYRFEGKLLNLFYLIRMLFAPILETVILLDRLLFLKENSFDNSFIVSLFDPVISPRCFGIISIK